jgi:hypothetical protein
VLALGGTIAMTAASPWVRTASSSCRRKRHGFGVELDEAAVKRLEVAPPTRVAA